MGHKYVKEDETFNTSRNGTVPKPTGQDITDNKFLRADGTWASGAGGSVVSADQVLNSGTEIGGVTVDGVRTAFYAPLPQNYSTTEKVIGTWIDGKPIYQCVYQLASTLSISSNTWTATSVSNANMKAIIKATAITTSGTLFDFLGAARDSGNYVKLLQVRPSGIEINVLILQYTKTTD